MTIKEAKAAAVSGCKVRHPYFAKGEYVVYNGKNLIDESGNFLIENEFWAIRAELMPKDWEIVGE